MFLEKLKLNNIRSYVETEIQFPEGIVLLSGDIGSGKSTILHSIEFALFGLLRADLSGAGLLRHGTNQGSVELTFKLDKTYTIKRNLRRTKTTVEQEAGWIGTEGIRKNATAVELKAEIINLLGYPAEFLTKTKNLLYRYTVYTPQEAIKQILTEEPEQRIALLRKVFTIDKYERIKYNSQLLTRNLREKRRAQELYLADEQEKQQHQEQINEQIKKLQEEENKIKKELEEQRQKLKQAQQKITEIEQQKQQHDTLTRQNAVINAQITSKKQLAEQIKKEINNLENQLQQKIPEAKPLEEIQKEIQHLNQQLTQHENYILERTKKITEQQTLKDHATRTIQKINNIMTCPTCLQDVTQEHKHNILTGNGETIQKIDQELTTHQQLLEQLKDKKITIKLTLEEKRQHEQQAMLIAMQIKQHQEKQQRKKLLEEQHKRQMDEAEKQEQEIQEITNKIKTLNIEEYQQYRRILEEEQKKEREHSLNHNTIIGKINSYQQQLEIITKEIEKKKEARNKLTAINKTHHWMSEMFIPLLDVMEKHVMARIHQEFNALFQQWFTTLIEDNIMTAHLDDTFTPVIQQNGYDTDITHLSGGERTACALAYRLALNKTVNTLIGTINTKDLLILDEPTEGFSTQQLDRVRDVIDQLGLKQTIIVSHEPKIESFANTIIRIEKEGHESRVSG